MMIRLILQILISVGLIGLVLLQNKGNGLGKEFAASVSYHTKKGLEKWVFGLTVGLLVAFVGLSLVNVLV